MPTLVLKPGKLTLTQLREVFLNHVRIELDEDCFEAIDSSAECVKNCIMKDQSVYGINTGFGLLATVKIAEQELQQLQHSLVLSHSAGIGQPFDKATTRLMMVLKINSLAQGYSGIRRSTIDRLITFLNHDILPVIPEKGSVGASGDLAPLAHMSCLLLGEGKAWQGDDTIDSRQALQNAGLKPITLAPKEGLALLNGTQASTALALRGLFGAENNFSAALVSGALSVDALMGSRIPFDTRIHQVRGHRGQIDVATALDRLLKDSEINHSHADCEKVQDPYSLRCQPQVMGACLDQARHAAGILLIEANAVSDNPLVFARDGDILSGGNFHAQPVAFAADNLALAISEIGSISERRIAVFMDKSMSGLPAFLIEKSGVNSGFMIAQVTAAALASENKSLAHPASVDSLPTSANQEDHVSMATFAARRLKEMNFNTAGIIAVEMMCAAQGIDFRAPLKSSVMLQQAMAIIRKDVKFYKTDRYLASDIEALQAAIINGSFLSLNEPAFY